MKQLSLKVSGEELRIRALGRQLLNITVTDAIMKQYKTELELAAYRILKRWHNQNTKADQTHLVRPEVTSNTNRLISNLTSFDTIILHLQAKRLVCALRDSDLLEMADYVNKEHEKYLDGKEGRLLRLQRQGNEDSTKAIKKLK